MRTVLEPILPRPEFSSAVECELNEYLLETLFAPVRDALPDVRENASDPVYSALVAGTLQYSDGLFTGEFNAEISKALRDRGARSRGAGLYLTLSEVPVQWRGAIAQSKRRAKDNHEEVLALLAIIAAALRIAPTGIDLSNTVDRMVGDLQEQFVSSVSSGTTPPGLLLGKTEELRAGLVSKVNDEAKKFAADAINDLRKKVQQNLAMGGRLDRLSRLVDSEIGAAQRKARIIAESAVAELVADFTESRLSDIGVYTYVWETMGDHKVRPTHGESNNHRDLNGRTFSFRNPPVVDSATGRRRNPGKDYGPCRCVARGILVT